MESNINILKVTVQGVNNPVPAAEGGENAGPRSSISSDCKDKNRDNTKNGEESASCQEYSPCREMVEPATPFGRSSVIRRTPPSTNNTSNRGSPKDIGKRATPNPQGNTSKHGDTFSELGELIVDLMEYVKCRNNVHHAIKDKVRTIRIMYNKIRDEKNKGENHTHKNPKGGKEDCGTTERETQTSPQVWPAKRDPKRDREGKEETPKAAKPKRQKRSPKKKRKTTIDHQKEKPIENGPLTQEEPSGTGNWETVKNKNEKRREKKRKKKRGKRPKPDVMIITTKGETSYADILRKLKGDPGLKGLGDEVNKIRRTQKGDLLLELKSSSVAEKFNDRVLTSLNGCAEVKTRKQEIVIECMDLDDITTESEIGNALALALNLPELDEKIVKSLRRTPVGTQIAKISLPVGVARKALELRRIKIGWSICRLKETITVTKCFRCLEYGHTVRFCGSKIDRSNRCRKCGEEGHFARACTSEARCILCNARGAEDLRHVTGSFKCPVFRKALSEGNKCE